MDDQFDFDFYVDNVITTTPLEVVSAPIPSIPSAPSYGTVARKYKKLEQSLINEYLSFNKLTQQHIDVYNQFTHNIANIIMPSFIDLKDGRKIYFVNLKWTLPVYKSSTGEDAKMYPQYARRHYKTYAADLTAQFEIRKDDNQKVVYTSNRFSIMKLPVMLFSNLCHLEHKSAAERFALGEDPVEQGGYFIIEGVEKIIMLEEKLSTNRMFIMHASPKITKKYRTQMKLITNINTGTILDELVYTTKKSIMKYSLQDFRKKDKTKNGQFAHTKKLNVIYIFKLFSELFLNKKYCYTNKDIIALVKIYLKDQKSLDGLFPSFSDVELLGTSAGLQILMKKANQENLSNSEKYESAKVIFKKVYKHIADDVQPKNGGETEKQLEERITRAKVNALALMVARYLDHLYGIIPIDDRDDWANKRLEGPGRKMENLTRSSLNKMIKIVRDQKLREDIDNKEIEKIFQQKELSEIINKTFRDSFINSKWGMKGTNQKNNATQTLVRDNMIATMSHINTINVTIQRTDKKVELRLLQSTQYGYVCYVKTPEGSSCFVCHTKVLLSTGQEVEIGNLKDGDVVMTIDPVTLYQKPSKIYNHFVKPATNILNITTLNNREITCTDDHPFLTTRGWILAKDLDLKTDLLVIHPYTKPLPHVVEILDRVLIFDETIFRAKLKEIDNPTERRVDSYVKELTDINLLPLYNDDDKLPILARIGGFMLADGNLSVTPNKQSYGNTYCFGTEYDSQLFIQDMNTLGVKCSAVTYRENTVTDKTTLRKSTHHAYILKVPVYFAALLLALDFNYGNRTKTEFKPVPEWIMSGTPLVKREFLSGFQGGDGSKIRHYKRPTKVKAYSLQLGSTIKHISYQHVNSLKIFMNQLADLFDQFDIDVLNVSEKLDYDDKHVVTINFSCEIDNIMKYMEIIGYRYATTKNTESFHVTEYLRYKQGKIDERDKLKESVIKLTDKGYRAPQIAKKLNISYRAVTSILEYNQVTKGNHTLAPKDTMGMEEWFNLTSVKNNCIYMPIKSIEPAEDTLVADFTTEHDNHSMVANHFVAHNCGLVKNLAITTRLSLDHGIDGDRIIQAYVTTTEEKTQTNKHILLLNGKYLGWCQGPETRQMLLDLRRDIKIHHDTSFYIDDQYLYVDLSPSRLIRPLLIVDYETQQLVLDMKHITDLNPGNLMKQGAMEYVSAWEEKNLKVAEDVKALFTRREQQEALISQLMQAKKLKDKKQIESIESQLKVYQDINKPYTHCEMSGRAALGVAADTISFMTHNQPARNIFQCLWSHELVLMADGSRIPIKDVKIGDEVVTFDPETMITSTTKVVNQFVRRTDKPIYKITSKCGRKIICTHDHKFMTNQGWMEVRDFDLDNTLLAIEFRGTYIYVHIDSIELHENVEIADITTESENHSFIAGDGFCVHNSAMSTQAVGMYHLNHKGRFDGTSKILESPTPPVVKTSMYDTLGLSERGGGQNVTVAFIPYPNNEEDSIIINQGAVDRGLFRMVKYFTYDGRIKKSDPNVTYSFGKFDVEADKQSLYRNLNEYGLPIIGSYIKEGECIIGIIRENKLDGHKINKSVMMNYGDRGIVDDIIFQQTDNYDIVRVKFHITRQPQIGDKFAARMAQKGTIGDILPENDMPFLERGGVVDIIINTSCIPSRMTNSYILELIAGKAAAYFGETVAADAFQEFDKDVLKMKLSDAGFNPNGMEILRSGITGERLEAEIYVGVAYFQALKHQPEDKKSVRTVGLKSSMFQQAVKGRTVGGGNRFGTMEGDALIGHGAASIIKERLCNVSDKYTMSICKDCGITTVYNHIEKAFVCPSCDTTNSGAVTIPYSLKYHDHVLVPFGIKNAYGLTYKMAAAIEEEEPEEFEELVEESESEGASDESDEEISAEGEEVAEDDDVGGEEEEYYDEDL